MSKPSTANAHFDGFPYLAHRLTDDCCHLTCLPHADEPTLLTWARREHEATGLAVHLVLAPGRSTLIDEFGEHERAGLPHCHVPLYGHLAPATALPWDEECAEREVRLAEHCWARTPEGKLAALGESQVRRLVAVLASTRERRWRHELWLTCAGCGAQVRGSDAQRVRRKGGDGLVVACRTCHERALVWDARAVLAVRLAPDDVARSAKRMAFALRRQRPQQDREVCDEHVLVIG